jgi:UDP-glucuronate decarboxylase
VKTCIVTGGAGFVGSHLCERLLQDGARVLCVDDLSTGSRKNVAHLLRDPMFRLIVHDVTTPLACAAEEIYNLACPASPKAYQKDPVRTTKTSFLGALNALELARWTGGKVLQASTSEVYGDPAVHPQSEGYWGNVNPIGVRACYDEGKRCAETLCFDFHRQHNVSIKVARIFNTYGPRMSADDGRVVSNFVVQAVLGEPITIYGDGSQTRSFCYVSDLVDGLIKLMNSRPEVVGPVNLGNPVEFEVRHLAELVVAMTGSSSPIIYCDLPADDPRRRKPDVRTARRLLNWTPKVSLEAGLQSTIQHFIETTGGAAVDGQPLQVAS